jgi:hypothetical protein
MSATCAILTRAHEGKAPRTREEAERIAARRNQKVPKKQPRYRAYECPVCKPWWHVGHV